MSSEKRKTNLKLYLLCRKLTEEAMSEAKVEGEARARLYKYLLSLLLFLLWREIVLSGYSYCSEYFSFLLASCLGPKKQGFCQKINCSQMKLLDLLTVRQKVPILDFQRIFYVKNCLNLSDFFSLKNNCLEAHFL